MDAVSSVSVDAGEAWAFGPTGPKVPRGRLRPFGITAGVLAGIVVAGLVGFVAFVNLVGEEDASTGAAPSPHEVSADEPAGAAPAVTQPLEVTDVRLTGEIDPATGEPGISTQAFAIGEPVQLWLSFDAGDDTAPLTAVWFRGTHAVARLEAPLPDASSQMVFPLPQVAVDRAGSYRVEVRSRGDVLAAETFEVTYG